MTERVVPNTPDFAAAFAALPGATAVFAADPPRFTVLAASDALLAVSHRPREAVVGWPLADAFPNASPEDTQASGLMDLRASLAAAVRTGAQQHLDRQRYDLPRPDGTWETRYWDAVNIPVLGPDGAVRHVLHQTADVTAQVHGEAAAAQAASAEQRAQGILERMSDSHCVLDRDFQIVGVNAAAERLLGRPRETLLGRSHWELFPASVDSPVGRAFRRVVAEGIEQHLTHNYLGEGYDLRLEVDAYPTDEGGVAMFWRDVTKRVPAEAALRLAAVRDAYRVALTDALRGAADPVEAQAVATRVLGDHLEASRVMYGEADPGSTETFTNHREYRRDPLMPSSLGSHRWYDFGIHVVTEMRAGRTIVADEMRLHPGHSADELAAYEALEIRAYVAVPLVRQGQIVAFLAVNHTTPHAWTAEEVALIEETAERTWAAVDRARAEVALRASEEQQRYLVRLGDALRPHANAATIQGEAVRVLGEQLGSDRAYYVEIDALRAEYVVEREWSRSGVTSQARRYPLAAWPMPSLANGKPWVVCDVDADPAMPDDQRALYQANTIGACVVVPLLKNGRLIATLVANQTKPREWTAAEIGLLVETAERTWAAVERARAEEALKENDRRKDEFLAMLGHELRNPLAPIRTVISLLDKQLGTRPEFQSMLGVLARQTTQLTRLVDDLLDVARLTQGRVALQSESVEYGAVIEQAIETIRTLAAEKFHQLRIHRPDEKLYVEGDRARLVQTVTNLLHNATKYTDPYGTVTVAVSATEQELVLSVQDTGVGISVELLPHIFDLFVQSERSLDRSQGGLGIGLSVARHLVAMHHGTLRADSAGLGHGATFEVRLPRISAPARVQQDVVAPGTPRRILIVDDNRDAADFLAQLLILEGHQVNVVYCSSDALVHVAKHLPEVVVLDIGMPHMDGYAVARALRAHHGDALRLIALTGYGRPEDRERSGAAGFDAHLVKPIDVQTLLDQLVGAGARPQLG